MMLVFDAIASDTLSPFHAAEMRSMRRRAARRDAPL
jgi:hypothetical protein